MADYAIISLGGKQYRVREGERLLVDRLPTAEGKTFHPDVLLTGGSGKPNLAPRIQVTAKVVGTPLGEKIRIGKYRAKKGYRRHTGFRAKLSEIEIQSIGSRSSGSSAAKKDEAKPAAKRPVRASGPGEGVRGNREVSPTKTSTAKPTAKKPAAAKPKPAEAKAKSTETK
jgi:large subunit ribosomal protein L21